MCRLTYINSNNTKKKTLAWQMGNNVVINSLWLLWEGNSDLVLYLPHHASGIP